MKLLIPVKEQTTCHYCATIFDRDLWFCPLCRKAIKDDSGRHTPTVQALKQIPITYEMPNKVQVSIRRGQGENENFKGTVLNEINSFYLVDVLAPYRTIEWFAKDSNRVRCHIVRPEGEPSEQNG